MILTAAVELRRGVFARSRVDTEQFTDGWKRRPPLVREVAGRPRNADGR